VIEGEGVRNGLPIARQIMLLGSFAVTLLHRGRFRGLLKSAEATLHVLAAQAPFGFRKLCPVLGL